MVTFIKNLIFFYFFVFAPFISFAQKDTLQLCDSLLLKSWKTQYYSFKSKYPLSSEKLVERVNREVPSRFKDINGFITFRFIINCQGYAGHYEIFQINNFYQAIEFEKQYIYQLFAFVKNLNNWPISKKGKKAFDYYTYVTFKVEHGNVTQVIP